MLKLTQKLQQNKLLFDVNGVTSINKPTVPH